VSIESLEILDMSGIDRSSLARQISSLTFNLSPAIVITALNLLSFMLHSFTASMITHGEKDQEKLIALYAFKMSTASAVIFLVFLVLYAMLADEGKAALSMAALNIVIILIPGLLYTTLMMLKRLTHQKKASCFGFILYLGAIALLVFLPQYSVIGGAIIGAAILIINDAKWSIIKNRSSNK
jgi:cytochrome bd-type quinol oxidase subunit 2